MSKYVRDDKQFREQIAALADAGLRFPTAASGQGCSLYRARPCSECAEPANFNGVPAYVRTIEPLEIAPKGRLPEFIAGLLTWALVSGAIEMTVRYILMPVFALVFGGAH